uniref:Putative secreted protein n=1 Tax=Amblyomma cajennense TaxID=34607 RepID=A0A023FS21_AMBCJ
MFTAADLCVFLGFLYAFVGAHGTAATYDTDARKVLFPPHIYWLYRRSIGTSDTRFTSNKRCVEMEYVQYNDTFDIVTLDARNHTEKEHWEPKMYWASVKEQGGNVLRYTPYEYEVDTATAVEYRVLHVAQNACYVAERIPTTGVTTDRTQEKTHQCELWLKKDTEVGHQRPTYTSQSLQACKDAVDHLCITLELVYYQRLCDSILP